MAPPRRSWALAIIMAAEDGDLRLLKRMARKTDLREAKDDEGRNALDAAATEGQLEVCRFLVEESGFDVKCTSTNGMTPVARAACTGELGVLRYLLDHGGDPATRDSTGTTPLHYAAAGGHYETVRLLLSRDSVDVDALNYNHASPLQLAAGNGHDQVVKVLLEHGSDPNKATDNMGCSPLIMACMARSLECTKLLVEAGADVNFTNPDRPTALRFASRRGLTDIAKFLLEAGADPNIPGDEDKEHTLFDDAKQQGNEAFRKGDYRLATFLYDQAILKDPLDATLSSNRSLCWLRLGEGKLALLDAQHCKTMRPGWWKAWGREGAALSLLKDYEGAIDAFTEARKLDPVNDEIKKALREATELFLKQKATEILKNVG